MTSRPVAIKKNDFRSLFVFGFLVVVVGLTLAGAFVAVQLIVSREPAGPAQISEVITIPGGELRVDQVLLENMAPMHLSKFRSAGMSMSGMGMDMAPEGYRRFTVEATLAAETRTGLRYDASDFQIAGDGVQKPGPVRHQLGNQAVAAGSAVAVTLVFEAPEGTNQLLLNFRDGSRPVAINLEQSAPSTDKHEHTGAEEEHHHEDGSGGH